MTALEPTKELWRVGLLKLEFPRLLEASRVEQPDSWFFDVAGEMVKGLVLKCFARWWQLKHFWFSPLPGEMIQFDDHIFQMGWNHQPVCLWSVGSKMKLSFDVSKKVEENPPTSDKSWVLGWLEIPWVFFRRDKEACFLRYHFCERFLMLGSWWHDLR